MDAILVANIGSTSFKFRLFTMPDERLLARGGVERIGTGASPYKLWAENGAAEEGTGAFTDYAGAIQLLEDFLKRTGLVENLSDLSAVGFKPVMAKGISGTQRLDEDVLEAMEAINTLLPAHNPPYVAAVRVFNKLYPSLPCIGTFETAFYDEVPAETYRYPVPREWEVKHGIRRYGFHGASHRFVTERLAELRGTKKGRVVSAHLGGSSSLACVKDGMAIDSSWGMTPQSGLPQNNRVGDFDAFAVIYAARELGMGLEEVERVLSKESGLKGMAGTETGDIRDVHAAGQAGSEDAQIAIRVYVNAIRKYIGQFALELNGLDALIFTAGIGENGASLRADVCANLDYLGLKLDPQLNAATLATETNISAPDSRVAVWVIPTNEEIVIARNAWALLQDSYMRPPSVPHSTFKYSITTSED